MTLINLNNDAILKLLCTDRHLSLVKSLPHKSQDSKGDGDEFPPELSKQRSRTSYPSSSWRVLKFFSFRKSHSFTQLSSNAHKNELKKLVINNSQPIGKHSRANEFQQFQYFSERHIVKSIKGNVYYTALCIMFWICTQPKHYERSCINHWWINCFKKFNSICYKHRFKNLWENVAEAMHLLTVRSLGSWSINNDTSSYSLQWRETP